MKAEVRITLKRGVLDPQGKAISHALATLGHDALGEVRQGKLIELELPAATDAAAAEAEVARMCEELLANPVIEDYAITILSDG